MFKKILIANRGEIAIRILRACQELGIRTVGVYSEADAQAMHTGMADEAVLIGPPPSTQSYLRGERIIQAALQTGAEAIHPGYGFLSENADFAEQVRHAGLTFIGPPAAAIRAMGDKTAARAVMQAAGVPVMPGYQDGGTDEQFSAAAGRLGYPVLVKAAAGGGGKGMRVVQEPAQLPDALATCRREAQNAFRDDRVYLEKFATQPRHIEFQILVDQQGHIVHLGERECSLQRRHQKVIEESPSPLLDSSLRERMGAAAMAAAMAAGYQNAGTVEFLVDAERRFYFLEMNTRLQVEHPVTEAVIGLDLVIAQLRIAAGEPLWFSQRDVYQRGHALEARIYAEDPARGFLPSVGQVLRAVEPIGPGVRVDAAVSTGYEVTRFYDPMIAKLIVWAEDRPSAIRRMANALSQYAMLGLTTNIPFLQALIRHPAFVNGTATTQWIDGEFANWSPQGSQPNDRALIAAAISELLQPTHALGQSEAVGAKADGDPFNPWLRGGGFRLGEG